MILKQRMPWLRMLISYRGSSLEDTAPRIAALTLLSAVATATEMLTHTEQYSLTTTPFTLIGIALAIFLGFRNNAAYDRYWEGRKLWGALVNASRTLARRSALLIEPATAADGTEPEPTDCDSADTRRAIGRLAAAFVHALRIRLRDQDYAAVLNRFLSGDELQFVLARANPPQAIVQLLGRRLDAAYRAGWLESYHLSQLEESLTDLTDVQGGCERIKFTPIPYAYTVLLHRIVGFYCLFLPFGLIRETGWLTPLVTLLICHAFFGLDAIGDEIEEPFGVEPHHLPLTQLCGVIEADVMQILDAGEAPPPIKPVDGVLL